MIRVVAVAMLVAACAPKAMPLTPAHPAHPDAKIGRLAGPPAALRPGVVDSVPQPQPPSHQGHEGHH